MDLASLTLRAARDALAQHEISSLELADFYLKRIARYDSQLNSFILVTADLARTQAQRADTERARGNARGALQGIPLAIKDLFDLRGFPTTAGSNILRNHIAQENAPVVSNLLDSGAVILGKNNLHEFAFGVTNDNPHFGAVHHPWHLDCVPGGSTGGGAAAVAARFTFGALGSDTGGSIRIPSALCGVTGIKPTYGRVSLRGVIPLSWSNDHAGPLAQTAEDCALILQAIAGYDAGDPVSANVRVPDFSARLEESVRGLRFAAPRGYFEQSVDDEILRAVREAERVLEELGAVRVEKELPDAPEMFETNRVTLRVEAATYHRDWLETRQADYGADVYTRLKSFQSIRADEYARARRRQAELTRALDLFFDDVDFFITPTTRIVAPRIGGDAVSLAAHLTAFTAPFDVTGVPAISVPCGFTRAGLPIGLQIVGRAWDEARILQVAHQYQRVTDWHAQVPPLFA
jgi:aspartyl-tRNA(Asn)/glutamyl-tRNA(Gln) amidotransferase subunit A